jgi:3-phenylpropionate/trans-cinnamate dioxygenase ferredoxin subunit
VTHSDPSGSTGVCDGRRDPVRVATLGEVAPGEAVVISRDTATTHDDIALVHTADGEWLAVDNTCSHALASLAYGWVDQDRIECPLHAAQFCLRTGEALSLPASEPVVTHRTEIRGTEVWLHPSTTKAEL